MVLRHVLKKDAYSHIRYRRTLVHNMGLSSGIQIVAERCWGALAGGWFTKRPGEKVYTERCTQRLPSGRFQIGGVGASVTLDQLGNYCPLQGRAADRHTSPSDTSIDSIAVNSSIETEFRNNATPATSYATERCNLKHAKEYGAKLGKSCAAVASGALHALVLYCSEDSCP